MATNRVFLVLKQLLVFGVAISSVTVFSDLFPPKKTQERQYFRFRQILSVAEGV